MRSRRSLLTICEIHREVPGHALDPVQMPVGWLGSGQIKDGYVLSTPELAAINDTIVNTAECFGKHLCRNIFSDIIRAGDWLIKGPVDIAPNAFLPLVRFGFVFVEAQAQVEPPWFQFLCRRAVHDRQV